MLRTLLVVAAGLVAVEASPRPSWNGLHKNASTPCAQVSASAAAQIAANTAVPTVDGQLAYDCLNSAQLHKNAALKLMDSILPFTEWQTDTSYLKDPPSAYLEPAVDIPAVLQEVRNKLENNTYQNEYHFQADLFRTFNLAHDGHFRFFPDLLTSAIRFSKQLSVVSVSLDGLSLPQIYIKEDVEDIVATNASRSPITTINGEDAVTFLENWSQLGALNDPDALYNSVFFSKPFGAEDAGWQGYFGQGVGRFGYIWPGANTTLGFANGTTKVYRTAAQVIGDFTGVHDGASLYQKFCTGPPPATNTTTPPPAPSATVVPGYPSPIIVSSDYIISGYYLNSTENSDVAVLSVITFEPEIPAEMQAVTQDFITAAKAAGKTKIIFDLSANGGGIILNGIEMFAFMFPQYANPLNHNTRFRQSEANLLISDQYNKILPKHFDPNTASEETIELWETPNNYRYDLNINNTHFSSPAEKNGPYVFNGDNFTNIIRWDLNDPLTTSNDTYGVGFNITGYGNRTNFKQPFAAEDIIMLYDGYCASTCTIFSSLMRIDGGVKSISVGGRPSSDPMQTLGGVKGANNYPFSYITELAEAAYDSGTREQKHWANWTALTALNSLADNRSSDNSINVRDNIYPSLISEGLPSQFVYEAADCRIFYEPNMVTDISNLWEAAASAAWGSKKCVQGGLDDLPKRDLTMMPQQAKRDAAPIARKSGTTFKKLKEWAWRGAVHGQKVPF